MIIIFHNKTFFVLKKIVFFKKNITRRKEEWGDRMLSESAEEKEAVSGSEVSLGG